MKRLYFIAVMALTLMVSGCTDNDLATVAKSLNAAQQAMGTFQTTVTTLNSQGTLSDDTTRSLLETALQIDQSAVIATETAKQLTTLAPTDRANLLVIILQPVIAAINTALAQDVITISNQKTRQDVQAALLVVLTSLNAAQIALEAH